MRTCMVDGCTNEHHARGYCSTHYSRFLRAGTLPAAPLRAPLGCKIEGCERKHQGHGFCQLHYNRWRTTADPLNEPRPKERDPNTDPRNMSGSARAEFGATVTFEKPDGERLTLHRIGGTKAAISACCDTAMFYDAGYRVIAISTPASIYSDLLQRLPNLGRSGTRKANGVVQAPEAQMLAAAGRREMLHPALERGEVRGTGMYDDGYEPRTFA